MKTITTISILLASVVIAQSGESAKSSISNCRSIAKTFRESLKGKPLDVVLERLSQEVTSSPHCSCELIKSAVTVFKPTPKQVATMVDVAINAAPDYIEDIVNCSVAAAPDAKSGILSTASDYGYTPNPLDYPGIIGEHPGGQYLFVPTTPIFIAPPQITLVDP